MAIQNNLKSLITDLERVLWEGQLADNPDVSNLLERIRRYLLTRQSTMSDDNYEAQAEKLTEVVLNRLETGINHWIQPLQGELEDLRRQRQSLLQEVETLEKQRQQILSDFAQKLSSYQENVSQTTSETPQDYSPPHVDQTLHQVFDSLVEDLQTYSESLREGLERMHGLGQQGEAKFLACFNRLQQQLEVSLNPISFQESTDEQTALIDGYWYLGIDLTASQSTLALFRVNSHVSDTFSCYSLSDYLNLSVSEESSTRSPLDYWKQAFHRLSVALTSPEAASLKLEELPLQGIFKQLSGIVLICPAQWNKGDRLLMENLLLETALVTTSEKIIWVPKAIALTLAYSLATPKEQSSQLSLVIELQETTTEVALVDLSEGMSGLMTQRFAYGTQAMDQDILCQLIYPQWYAQMTQTIPSLREPFPTPGESDLSLRQALDQQLNEHPLGNGLIEAAKLTRFILEQQETFSSTLAQQPWGVTREAMNQTIIHAWRQQINKNVNVLLNQTEKSPSSLTHIILSGEGIKPVSYGLSPWLKDRFAQARLVKETQPDSEHLLFHGITSLLLSQKTITVANKG